MVVAACSVAGVAGLVLAGYCWYRFVFVDIFQFLFMSGTSLGRGLEDNFICTKTL